MKNMDALKNRRIRIAILELLKVDYPGTMDMRMLQFSLDNLGYPLTTGALRAHINYLEEKKYLRVEHRKGLGFDISFAALTANGWDLLDGHLHEKGIDDEL